MCLCNWTDYSSEDYQWSLTVQSGTVILLYTGIQIWWEKKNWWEFFAKFLKSGGSKMIYKKLFNQNRGTTYNFIQACIVYQ